MPAFAALGSCCPSKALCSLRFLLLLFVSGLVWAAESSRWGRLGGGGGGNEGLLLRRRSSGQSRLGDPYDLLKEEEAKLATSSEKYAKAVEVQSKIMSDFSDRIKKLQTELELKLTKRKTEVRPLRSLVATLTEQLEVLGRQTGHYTEAADAREDAAKKLEGDLMNPLRDALDTWEKGPCKEDDGGAALLQLLLHQAARAPIHVELDGKMVEFEAKMAEYKGKLEEVARKSEVLEEQGALDRRKSAATIAKLQREVEDLDSQIKEQVEESRAEIKRLRKAIEEEEAEVGTSRESWQAAPKSSEAREDLGPLLERVEQRRAECTKKKAGA